MTMKKLTIYLVIAMMISSLSCSKSISERNLSFPSLKPSKTDINAGSWKPVLLTAPTDITVAAPAATNTPDYIAQINEIKSWQSNVSSDEKNSVAFWSAGAVLRWNEILRELVAKHNLPPYQNADGTYPVPNANNPLAYPTFP